MTIGLTQEHLDLRDAVRAFANRHITEDTLRAAADSRQGDPARPLERPGGPGPARSAPAGGGRRRRVRARRTRRRHRGTGPGDSPRTLPADDARLGRPARRRTPDVPCRARGRHQPRRGGTRPRHPRPEPRRRRHRHRHRNLGARHRRTARRRVRAARVRRGPDHLAGAAPRRSGDHRRPQSRPHPPLVPGDGALGAGPRRRPAGPRPAGAAGPRRDALRRRIHAASPTAA